MVTASETELFSSVRVTIAVRSPGESFAITSNSTVRSDIAFVGAKLIQDTSSGISTFTFTLAVKTRETDCSSAEISNTDEVSNIAFVCN